ncbi:MAG: amidophosphoribosyltransferase [Planctomycetota bacterium]|nr:amidophosphoribosyltransferase [Planctomycetota bacterium]
MCGFIGLYAGPDTAFEMADGLLVLQHRGQDAAGITSFDGDAFHTHRASGLVQEIFTGPILSQLPGNVAIGHTRYPTVGGGTASDAQPLYTNSPYGIAMAHNGNVTNFVELKKELSEREERRLGTDCDVEAILNIFAAALRRRRRSTWPDAAFIAMREVFKRVRGSYSGAAIVGGKGLVAFRDPFGIKPAILGRRRAGRKWHYCVTSESAALNVLGYDIVGDLEPGEVVIIDNGGNLHRRVVIANARRQHHPCVFEFIYFARPDSVLDDISVYKARLRLGETLAAEVRARGIEPDIVVPVPDSARPAALECARVLDVRYREGLLKNRYVGRTFIMPGNVNRAKNVKAKLTTLPMELEGKKVLLVDDSVVRGTTTKSVVGLVRKAGATHVYVGVSSPKIKHPCVYGIDMQTRNEFIAKTQRSDKKIAETIGADAIVYMSVDQMTEAVRGPTERVMHFCKACMDGKYPTGDVTPKVLRTLESERNRASREATKRLDNGAC